MITTINCKKVFINVSLMLLVMCFYALSFSQDPIMVFEGKITDASGKKLSGATVKIYRNGQEVSSSVTGSNGRYENYEAYYGYVYKVVVTKDGLVQKSVEIDAKENFFEEDVEEEIRVPIDVSMVKKEAGIDYSPIENQPVAKFHIDKNTGLLDIDYPFVNGRKKEIEDFFKRIAAEAKNKDKRFNELVKAGDKALKKKDYESAIKNWKSAIEIKEDDELLVKITDTEMLLDEVQGERKIQAKFDGLIKEGDDLLAGNKFDEAIAKYQEAQTVLPKDKLPKQKIQAVNDKRDNLEKDKIDKEYNDLMAQAETEIKAKEYTKAIETLTKAKGVKPKERTPDSKIKQINEIIAKEAKNKAQYDNLITTADGLFDAKDYKKAKENYEDALALISGEEHPTNRIAEIKTLLADQEKADQELKEKRDQYETLIKQADKELKSKDYTSAKDSYTKAAELFPDESYPKGKLTEIENLIAQSEAEYQQLIKDADKLVADKSYEDAIAKYESALNLKKQEAYPKQQIEKTKALLVEQKKNALDAEKTKQEYDRLIDDANKHFTAKNYNKAKETYKQASQLLPDEQYPKDQLSAIENALKELEDQYKKVIVTADAQMESGKFKDAITSYESALKMKDDQYPKDQIEKAKGLIADKEKEALNAQELEKKYADLKAQGDKELSNQNYNLAKEKYEEALRIKPDAKEPKKQIAFIDEMNRKRKERFDKYIAQADELFDGEKFEVSIEKYEEALWILPVEQYPKDQIEKARKKLEEAKNSELAEKEKEEKYKQLINKANASFNLEKYREAKSPYTEALTLKPAEQYPKDQLAIIEAKLKELEEKNAAAKKEADKERKYNQLIAQADKEYANDKFEIAKESYKKALEIKTDKYPENQIEKINKKLAQLTQDRELKKQYDKIIAVADKNFTSNEFTDAKELYNRAYKLYPYDEYPKRKILEIEKLEADIALRKKQKAEEEARNNIKYQKLIVLGDDNFGAKKWELSKQNFEEALTIKPTEQYPKDQLAKIQAELDAIAAERAKYKKMSDDYFKTEAEIYGTEVDMNEGDAIVLMKNTKDNREYRNYLKVRNYVDSMRTVGKKERNYNTNTTYLSFKDYEKVKELIMKEQGDNDMSREAAITSYELFNNYYVREKQKLVETGLSKNSEISNELDVLKESLGEDHKDGQASIEQNAKQYERLNDRYYDENKEAQLAMIDKSSEIYDQTTQLKESLGEQHLEGQAAIEENADNYEALNNRFADEKNDKNLEMIEFQGEIALQIDDLKEKLITEYADGQFSIEQNAKEYEALNDRLLEQKSEDQLAMIDKNSEIYDQTTRLKEEIGKNQLEGQAAIEENADNYERLNNRFADEKQDQQNQNIDKTSEIYDQTTNLKDQLQKNQNDGQEKIEKNAEGYEKYNDQLTKLQQNQVESQTRAGQEVAADMERVKEKASNIHNDGNLDIEKNAIKYESLSDRLANEDKLKKEENTDNSYRNAQDYEYKKDNLDKQQSDNTVNELALMFPQGVTQKTYQRKNTYGDVIEVTVRRIVVDGNKGGDYRKTTNRSGTYYFKNGQPITSSTWDIETSGKIVNNEK